MWACGRGWVNPAEGLCAALDTFLHPPMNTGAPPPIDQFDCSQLPADFPTAPMLHVHNRHLYLLLAIAFCWRIFGVAWSSLTPLYGLLFGIAMLAAYGIFRLAMRRSLALFCALMLMLSSPASALSAPFARLRKSPFYPRRDLADGAIGHASFFTTTPVGYFACLWGITRSGGRISDRCPDLPTRFYLHRAFFSSRKALAQPPHQSHRNTSLSGLLHPVLLAHNSASGAAGK